MKNLKLNHIRHWLLVLALTACVQPSSGINWFTWTQNMTVTGNMRTERRPDDAPVTRQLLIDNFRLIAFEFEKGALGGRDTRPQESEEFLLRKWRRPILYELLAPSADYNRVLAKVTPFMTRLASQTGHPIRKRLERPAGDDKPNLVIFYGSDADFAFFEQDLIPPVDADEITRSFKLNLIDFIARWRIAPSPCAGKAYVSLNLENSIDPEGTILAAVVVIKRETPDKLLDACIEEELSQVLGLLNDDPDVRPSLFNDDQEFALLTGHDEYLLKILYDDRLEPGMTPEVAMPIVRRIVEELLPES